MALAVVTRADSPDFNRDVRPILAKNCFKCHGPDDKQRQAGLRLDQQAGALARLANGHRALAPGKPQESLLVKRIFSHGADIMPPAYANKTLTEDQKEILRRWIAAGAEYKPHWAFVPPKQAPLPKVKQTSWSRNPIDNFILARLEREGLKPSPEADRYTLARRVSLDLIGLPPTPEETDAFVQDKRPDAYERMVDRLLASPQYGERWARRWLDLARYADTNGYEKDRPRSLWPYRDWVINALNADMPFTEFTIEQIAGDMLPNATPEQKIATGFHRNTMLNEEGGIDPLEYRFHAMTDRVATTGTVWLGLTVGCAQCHSHKYDPITQTEYYRTMAFLDNADEPMFDVSKPDIAAQRGKIEAQVAERLAHLAERFPPEDTVRWSPLTPRDVKTVSGAKAETLPDNSVRLSGINPDTDSYTVTLDSALTDIGAVRLETLPDPSLGANGPGRTPHGNFVLTEFEATVALKEGVAKPITVHFTRAEADFAQEGFPAQNALDGNAKTGWAIQGPGQWNVARAATFYMEKPIHLPAGGQWTFQLHQDYGGHHTIGRFRLSLGQVEANPRPLEVRRQEGLEHKFAAWLKTAEGQAVRWRALRPVKMQSNLPLLTLQSDGSILVSGDETKRDIYDLDFRNEGGPITAIRLEALPDEHLPGHGPGRTFYEGGFGDFLLSEFTLTVGGKPVKFASATQSGGTDAKAAIDGDPESGWSINGRQGETTIAVFRLSEPLKADAFSLQLLFERYFASDLGHFRISATSDMRPAQADLPPDIEDLLLIPSAQRTAAQQEQLRQHFLSVAPELQGERAEIAKLRSQEPAYPTTLIFTERPESNPRVTHIHHRGEFLQPEEAVMPGVPAILPQLPPGAPANRLAFARWLVSDTNPLVGRVTMNRQWAAIFGRGIVRTTEDFGYMGDPPTHPELLDWLAVEFRKEGWSLKKMHRLIVTSATYRQSSQVTPELLARDPENRLLARGPRVRLEAELVRDSTLTISGLLSHKLGGPSVFPPQPPGVSSEGAYGPLAWNVSQGEDRYRRGLYTFSKRSAPYAMLQTFDAPSGEVCVARRDVSNTPLQALTLLNDQVFMEASQALGKLLTARPGTPEAKAAYLFRRCVTRPPSTEEQAHIVAFYSAQKQRFEKKELDAAAVAGMGEGDVNERAAWTVLARSLLNLDEVITKR